MFPTMELLVLILVNIATAVAMYVVFSIRFTRAVREARANPIIRELKDNIQITIEFINTSLDLMDEKTKTFYQLVRRSEEIAGRLQNPESPNAATVGPPPEPAGKDGKPAPRKKRSRKKTARSAGSERSAEAPAAERHGAGSGAVGPTPGDSVFRAPASRANSRPAHFKVPAGVPEGDGVGLNVSDPMERALSGLGDDRLDLTPTAGDTEGAYRMGEQSANYARAFADVRQSEPGPLGQLLSGMGRRIRGLFGGSQAQGSVDTASPPAAPASKPENADFAGVLARTGDQLVAKAEKEAAGAGAKSRKPRSMDARDILELSAESAEEILAQSLAPGGEPPSSELQAAQQQAVDRTGPAADLHGRLRPRSPEHEKLDIEAILARSGLDLRDRSPGGRADRIKELLRHGYEPRAIAAGTGIALPEVELIASLPEGARRPRRHRRGTED